MQQLAGLDLGAKSGSPEQLPPQPPRPSQPADEEDDLEDDDEEDENDPFADRNAVSTPQVEKDEPTWLVIDTVLYCISTNLLRLGGSSDDRPLFSNRGATCGGF